ncbi:MAG: 50S ribosomal protein L18e [Euryarchaeota archaeon]|nr:50S ribosomal protein L18e [Euryarchaeota archaeon]
MRKSRSTNPKLQTLITELARLTHSTSQRVWRDLAERLAKPRRNRAEVNVSRIARYTREGDVVAVPGKVLGSGSISHAVTVAALAFSESAMRKIAAAGGRCMSIEELMREKPKGVRVME